MATRRLFIILSIFTFISCEEILFEIDITSKSIEILSPKDNTVVEAATVYFDWEYLEGATAYEIQLATPDFENTQQIIFRTTIEETTYSEDLPSGNYEWRVRGINGGFITGFTSAKFKVESTINFSAKRVSLLSPSDNYITNSTVVTLEWQGVEEASDYRIRIIHNGEVIKEETTSATAINIDFPEGEFLWKVRAENETQNTFYSTRTILVERTAPNTPVLESPENNSTTSVPLITFQWSRESIAGSVESDSLFIYKDANLETLMEKQKVSNSYTTTLDRDQTYYWFMKAYDQAGNRSARSAVFSFTVN